MSSGPPNQTVPDVKGKTRASAESALRAKGFKVKVTEQSSDSVAKGRVISQNPGAGISTAAGTTVTIVVSSGKPPVEVPDVVSSGMFPDEAQATLEGKGFKVNVQYQLQAGTGRVVNQDPAAGKTAPYGSTVTIWVDSNPPG